MKLRNILISPDLWISLAVAGVLFWILPTTVKITFFLTSYGVGITVLSIIFSLFFASLAIVMTSSDDDYVVILGELGVFRELRRTFEFTLGLLFISLLYSIAAYFISDYVRTITNGDYNGHKAFFVLFVFLFLYSLLAALPAVRHTIRFSQNRVDFLMKKTQGLLKLQESSKDATMKPVASGQLKSVNPKPKTPKVKRIRD